ncbi:MAG: GAK system XXXCH domain-containing protein [Desulfobacterales bacterium]|nr:MAG: GAK system XXXCH domain-containing protein [Desulfobacterales bacterium]UCD91303.1 MAG: GAK system XXXCH domain-containing protein [Desulfobacterales bacterium]
MKEYTEKKMGREELAKQFEDLAHRIRKGSFSSKNRAWSVPDEIDAKIQFKEKKGRFEAKLKFRWSTLKDYDQDDRKALDDWHDSKKSIKKRMMRAYKNISRSVKDHQLPEQTDLEALFDSSQAFFRIADPDMEDAMEEFMDHLDNLNQAKTSGLLNVVGHEVRDIGNRMRNCHREFK